MCLMMTDLEIRMLLGQMTDGQKEIFMTGVRYERERIIKLLEEVLVYDEPVLINREIMLFLINGENK